MTPNTRLLLIEAVQKAKREVENLLGETTAISLYSPILQELAELSDSPERPSNQEQASEIPWDFPSKSTGHLLNIAQEISNALGKRGMCLYKPHKQPLTIGARPLTSEELTYIQVAPPTKAVDAKAPTLHIAGDRTKEVVRLVHQLCDVYGNSSEISRVLGWYSTKLSKLTNGYNKPSDEDLRQLRQLVKDAGIENSHAQTGLLYPISQMVPAVLALAAKGMERERMAQLLSTDQATIRGIIMRSALRKAKGPSIHELKECRSEKERLRLLKKGYPTFNPDKFPSNVRHILTTSFYEGSTQ